MKTSLTRCCAAVIFTFAAFISHSQTAWQITGNSNITNSNFIGTKNKTALKLRTNNNVRMTISSSGNIGIGTTSPKSKLDVAGTITGLDSYFGKTYPLSAGTSGADYSSVGYGLTFTDTTATYRYRLHDYSSMLSFRSGGFDFNTAPIGAAGNRIFYTTVMTILENGNVGINTLTPANKLSVAGTGDFLGLKATGTSDFAQVNMSVLNVISSGSVPAHITNTGNTNSSHGLQIIAGSNTGNGAYFTIFYRPDATFCGGIFQVGGNGVSYGSASDKRLKNIVGTTQKGLSDLMKIKIYDYTFKSDPNKQVRTGFMAQELYDVFPQSVRKPLDNDEPAEKNPWLVDYGSVTPLIIKAVQELDEIQNSKFKDQNDEISELKKENIELKERLAKLEALMNVQTAATNVSSASLQQNIPNPFNHTTTINYTLPQTYFSAKIIVTDKSGKSLKEVNVSAKGNGSLKLDASTLASGAYQYSLYVDGKLIDTKQMVLAK